MALKEWGTAFSAQAAAAPAIQPPFSCTGTLYSATLDVSGDAIRDTKTEMRVHLARQ
jgi:hypothetical protein